ncbi:MAG: heavy metal translocating P-type ATPase [Clostridia bacterium]|nr:cadmium-translocating P-type ATPase [Clostridium sp.]
MKSYRYKLEGLDCAACAKKVEEKLASISGFEDVNVNFSTLKLSFRTEKYENDKNLKNIVEEIVRKVEPDVNVIENSNKEINEKSERSNVDIIRIIVGVLIYFIGMKSNFGKEFSLIFLIISLVILLYKIVPKAIKQIVKNKSLDENALIAISAIGACFVDKAMEGIMVITLYEIGKILESKAISKTRNSISSLMDIRPEYANIKDKEEIKKVSPEEVKIGDIIVIKSGEKIPLDGIIIKGEAEIDNSALTGESELINVKEDSKVLSGGINVQGLIEVKVEKIYEDSTVSQILNLVENATDKKAKTENFVSKAAKIYTPIVLGLAVLVAIFMPIFFKGVTYQESIYKALIFLVISCPCSIAISVPLSYFSGIGKASKRGILVKGSDYLDGLKDIKQIVFDKTGTITTGNFKLSEIKSFNEKYNEKEILKYFVMGESYSNHPIAKSILNEVKNEDIDIKQVRDFEEIAGKGLKYKIQDKEIIIGNKSIMNDNKITSNQEEGTILFLKINDEVVGSIKLIDEIKPDVKTTMKKLSDLGIKTKMFTGDKKEIAQKIAKEVGIKEVKYEMLPQNKYEELEKVLQGKKPSEKVAYVGDGINDSPVLARADIGISMGGVGSSSAIEASDIVIMTDELSKVIEGIEISKKTNKIIMQNLVISIGIKLLVFTLTLFGLSDMWEAVFADVGVTLITVFNTLRILK